MAAIYHIPLDRAIERIATEGETWIRYAAAETGGEWSLRVFELTTLEEPPEWQTVHWEYANAVFAAARYSGTEVAEWLRTRTMVVGSRTISLAYIADNTSCERRESGWRGNAFEPLPWPCDYWQLGGSASQVQNPYDLLIADGSPSFVSFDAATANLLRVPLTGWNMTGREFVARFQDNRARLTSVVIRAAEVEAVVDGSAIAETAVELAGHAPGPVEVIHAEGTHVTKFALTTGLPEGAWIVIHQGGEWLDRKFLSWPYAQNAPPGVEIEVEQATRLEVLVGAGEGPTTEFKERLPGEDSKTKRAVMKTVAAFANGEGGSILFGVTDEGDIVGLEGDLSITRDRLTNLVRTWVSPAAKFDIEVIALPEQADRHVLILAVHPGSEHPYAAGTQPTNLTFYVRRGATSFPASVDEVRALAQIRTGGAALL